MVLFVSIETELVENIWLVMVGQEGGEARGALPGLLCKQEQGRLPHRTPDGGTRTPRRSGEEGERRCWR